jgi:chemotaxis protein MotA
MVNFFRILRKAFVTQPDPGTVIPYMMDLAARARREGILALEPLLKNVEDSFLRKGLQLTVDGLEPESIREIMQTEISTGRPPRDRRRRAPDHGHPGPGPGLVGTLIGLVQMLQKMSDPTTIGPAMAVGWWPRSTA